jgi:hypothetical protein
MLSKRDRVRIDRLSSKIDEYRNLADATDDPVKRDRYLELAKRGEKSRQTQRTFPLSILLWGIGISLILFPWGLLKRAGNEGWGVVGSIVMIALLGTINVRLRSRHR